MTESRVDALVAQKYAHAFVNIYMSIVSLDVLDNFSHAEFFLKKHRHILLLLSLPHITESQREHMVHLLVAQFSLPVQCEDLFMLMIVHRRFYLIPAALCYI